jgi:hypothetical protein
VSIGAYTPEERRRRIERYLDKRKRRVWTKRTQYRSRKSFADGRVRVKGRFVSKKVESVLSVAGVQPGESISGAGAVRAVELDKMKKDASGEAHLVEKIAEEAQKARLEERTARQVPRAPLKDTTDGPDVANVSPAPSAAPAKSLTPEPKTAEALSVASDVRKLGNAAAGYAGARALPFSPVNTDSTRRRRRSASVGETALSALHMTSPVRTGEVVGKQSSSPGMANALAALDATDGRGVKPRSTSFAALNRTLLRVQDTKA